MAGLLGSGRPMGLPHWFKMSCYFWLLKQSSEKHSSCCDSIAFQTVWCPSKHSISSPQQFPQLLLVAIHYPRRLNNLIWLRLHASVHKRCFPAWFSSFLVWNWPTLPRLCLSQMFSLIPNDLLRIRTWTQLCDLGQNLELLGALSPSFQIHKIVFSALLSASVKVKQELWGRIKSTENL